MNGWLRLGIWALLTAAMTSPAHAAWTWPYKDAHNAKHPGTTLHAAVQHPVRPLGNQRRAIKPIGATHAPPKTILAKRPP